MITFYLTFCLSWTGIPEIFIFCVLICVVPRFKEWVGKKCFLRNTSSQHSCCMRCVCRCKYCMLHTCISLKMMNTGSYIQQHLVSFLPIVGTDGGMLDMILFLIFSKMNSVIFFKKIRKTLLFKPKVATNQLLNCH